MGKTFTVEEVAQHNKEEDCWIIINNKVYDMTKFLHEHPGGKKVVLNLAGKDSTEKFNQLHKPEVLAQYGPDLYIGDIANAESSSEAVAPFAANISGPRKGSALSFGELLPFCDPAWYQDFHSSYYTDSHRRFRAVVREFVDKEITPFCHEWDETKTLPRDIYTKSYEVGLLPAAAGSPWPVKYVGTHIAGGVKPEEFDAFHELILTDELSRCGSGGVLWGLFGGLAIGLPPIINFGSDYLRDKCVRPCLTGQKVICLAITEPYAGSDVANLRTEAKLTPDGKHYIVNGEKKWITNGVFADFFTVAVRTGEPDSGMMGLSMILIEKSMAGVSTKQMKCSGVWPSGTAYITFEDVKVPVENLIGNENEGFRYIMANFNHERWGICVQAGRFARVCFEEAFKYAHKRRAFGKRLIDQPVIRNKLAHMARHIEATHNWLENITFQMTKMTYKEQASKLGGPIALLKAQTTQTYEFCAREAAQIFGGLAYTRGGQGEKVERLSREVKAYSIPGGSEEIMLDLGMRMAMKRAKL